jgi:hypothetical protein
MVFARAGIDLTKTRAELNLDEELRFLAQKCLMDKEGILAQAMLRDKRFKFDGLAGELVLALHAGRFDEKFQRTNSTNDCDLLALGFLANVVRHGRGKILRQFFDAVGRFHSRASGDGPSFRVAPPGNPKLRRALEALVLAEEPLLSRNDFGEGAADHGSPLYSPRQLQRLARQLGAKPENIPLRTYAQGEIDVASCPKELEKISSETRDKFIETKEVPVSPGTADGPQLPPETLAWVQKNLPPEVLAVLGGIGGFNPNNALPETGWNTSARMLKGIDLNKPFSELSPDERRRVSAHFYLGVKEGPLRSKFDIAAAVLVLALHDGQLDERLQRTDATTDDDLFTLGCLARAVRHGDSKALRAFADAVGRFYPGSRLDGRVVPADMSKLRGVVVASVLSGAMPMSGYDLAEGAVDLGSPPGSERQARRIHRRVGGKPAKPGRRRKAKHGKRPPKKPIEPLAETKGLVAQGSQAFWARRGKK